MNDDTTTDGASIPEPGPEMALASAYLDGVADADERAQVESSPELQGLVASLGRVRVALADVPPPTAQDRDDAVAAALAEFDVLRAAPVAAAAVVPLASRARWSRVLIAAAAAVIVGIAGVAAIKALGGDNAKSSSVGTKAEDSAASVVPGVAGSGSTAGVASLDSSPQSTIGAINQSAYPLPAYDRATDLRTLPSSVFDTVDGTAVGTNAGGAPTPTKAPPPPGQPLTGQLVFPFNCPLSAQQLFIAEILWQGKPAAAVRDTVSGVTQAIDPQCNVLVSVEP